MSYMDAKSKFNDNLEIIGGPDGQDVLMWNLSSGLFQLAGAIESDMQRIQSELSRISGDLRRIR